MRNGLMAEFEQLKSVVAPGTDMNTAAISGARVKLSKFESLAILIQMGTSTAANVVFSLQQHNAASGGTSKALLIKKPYYYKAGAAVPFTKVEPTADGGDAEADLSTQFAADGGYVIFEVLPDDLDVNGGFAWASLQVEDSAAAKLIAASYVLRNAKFQPAYLETDI